MYVGQAAAFLHPASFTASQQPKDQTVEMLNNKANNSTSPLETARNKVCRLRDALEASYNPDIEKVVEGYLGLSSRYKASKEQLHYQSGQLEQYQSLSSQYGSIQQELNEKQAQYQSTFDGANQTDSAAYPMTEEQQNLFEQISTLRSALSEIDQKLSNIVKEANEYYLSGKSDGAFISDKTAQFLADNGKISEGPFTKENFVSQASDQVKELQKDVKQKKEALIDYCDRYGLTSYDIEQYLTAKGQLNAEYYTAQQELLDLLHQEEGEDSNYTIDAQA